MMETLNYPLSNVQIELMKLYSTNLSNDDINDLRDLLSRFFADRATKEANKIWDERGLTNEDMDKWLNERK